MAKKGTPKREILAYTAGIIDGEGYIGITKSGKHKSGTIRYTLKVVVGSTDRPMVEFLREYFGGNISIRKVVGNRQPQWAWEVASNKAVVFLRQIIEFLRIKKLQAEVAFEFQKNGRPMRRATVYEIEEMQYCISKLKKLNAVGKKEAA